MSTRRSRIRKRERQKRRHAQRLKQSLILPPKRTVTSADLFQLVQQTVGVLARVIEENKN